MTERHLILTQDGEYQVVERVEYYSDATILQRNVGDYEFGEVVDGKLVEATERKKLAESRAAGMDMSREELVERLLEVESQLAATMGTEK